jgi:hypothetical protein
VEQVARRQHRLAAALPVARLLLLPLLLQLVLHLHSMRGSVCTYQTNASAIMIMWCIQGGLETAVIL